MVRASIRRFFSSSAVDVVVRLAVVASLAGSGVAVLQTRDLAQCVAAYNDANNTRTVVLGAAADAERAAERKVDDAQADLFLSPILTSPIEKRTAADQAELLKLFRAYQAALTEQKNERRAADDARRSNPVPDPPRDTCG